MEHMSVGILLLVPNMAGMQGCKCKSMLFFGAVDRAEGKRAAEKDLLT